MQNYSRDFSPVRSLTLRLQKAQVGDKVLLVIGRRSGIGRRVIGDGGIQRRIAYHMHLGGWLRVHPSNE